MCEMYLILQADSVNLVMKPIRKHEMLRIS